jgi:hypothetical protein
MTKSQTERASNGLEDRNALSAAFIAAGIGIAVMGVAQFVAELVEPFNDALVLNEAIGAYSGKYALAYGAWLVSWAVLSPIAKAGKISVKTALIVMAVLVLAGAVLVFPPFYGLFVSE